MYPALVMLWFGGLWRLVQGQLACGAAGGLTGADEDQSFLLLFGVPMTERLLASAV
jgi:hypothetical protein